MSASSLANLHEISSSDEFRELLSLDLERVSLINFWAPWAEPCKQMNEVVLELARKYQQLLVLQVEAETQAEISESFDVESVPSFVILRGHTLLSRINGADAAALTRAIAQHIDGHAAAAAVTETQEALDRRLRALMNQNKVVLFMKGSPDVPRCGFSRKIVALLREQGVEFSHFDILSDESVRNGLKVLNDWPTFPQLIVKGEFVGGLDIVQEMATSGELKEVVN